MRKSAIRDGNGAAGDRQTGAVHLEFWDSLSGERGLQSGIFLVWTKRSGYAKSLSIRSIKSRMRTVSPGTRIEAGRSSIVCSGQ